jgi:hypothetical protein
MTIIIMFHHGNFRFYHVGITRSYYFFISSGDLSIHRHYTISALDRGSCLFLILLHLVKTKNIGRSFILTQSLWASFMVH